MTRQIGYTMIRFARRILNLRPPLTITELASLQWDMWAASRSTWLDSTGQAVCPYCSTAASLSRAQGYSITHPSWLARRRWRRIATEEQTMLTALGSCRCAHVTTLDTP